MPPAVRAGRGRGALRAVRPGPPGSEDRKRLVDALTIELVRHSVTQEQYLHPAVRKHLDGGHTLADKGLAACARIEHLLNELQQRQALGEDFEYLAQAAHRGDGARR